MFLPSDYDRYLPDPSPIHDSAYFCHSTSADALGFGPWLIRNWPDRGNLWQSVSVVCLSCFAKIPRCCCRRITIASFRILLQIMTQPNPAIRLVLKPYDLSHGWFESGRIVIIYDWLFPWFISVASRKFLDVPAVELRSLPFWSFSSSWLLSLEFVQDVYKFARTLSVLGFLVQKWVANITQRTSEAGHGSVVGVAAGREL
jgi:hypothetical protein